jgi:hypothetical protein
MQDMVLETRRLPRGKACASSTVRQQKTQFRRDGRPGKSRTRTASSRTSRMAWGWPQPPRRNIRP